MVNENTEERRGFASFGFDVLADIYGSEMRRLAQDWKLSEKTGTEAPTNSYAQRLEELSQDFSGTTESNALMQKHGIETGLQIVGKYFSLDTLAILKEHSPDAPEQPEEAKPGSGRKKLYFLGTMAGAVLLGAVLSSAYRHNDKRENTQEKTPIYSASTTTEESTTAGTGELEKRIEQSVPKTETAESIETPEAVMPASVAGVSLTEKWEEQVCRGQWKDAAQTYEKFSLENKALSGYALENSGADLYLAMLGETIAGIRIEGSSMEARAGPIREFHKFKINLEGVSIGAEEKAAYVLAAMKEITDRIRAEE